MENNKIKEEVEVKIIEDKKEKIKERINLWLKDSYNLIFLAILIFLIIFRFYWFFKLGNQPLWWDEADYMNIARTYIGTDYWRDNFLGSDVVRPILLPLIIAGFFFLGLGETSVRLFILIASIASLPLIYGIGKRFFDKNAAIFSSAIFAVFWSFSFYSHRILVEVFVVLLWLATIFTFFNAYFNNKNWKHFALAGIFLGLSFLMKFSSWVLVLILAVYLVTTEKMKIFKNKKVILFYLSSLLTVIPYFLYNYMIYRHPLAFLLWATGTRGQEQFSFLVSISAQTLFSVRIMYLVFVVLFIVGLLISLSHLFLLYNKIAIKKSNSNKYYFILLWLILCLIFFGFFVIDVGFQGPFDERYYFIFYPALFLLAGKGCSFVYDIIKKYHKVLALIIILAILGLGAYQNIIHANQTIEVKKDSYLQLKQAGEFVGENTNPEDIIFVLEEQAEISYYSERNYVHIWGDNETTLLEKIKEHNPKYAVVSFYIASTSEDALKTAQIVFSNPDIFKPIKFYPPYIDQQQTIPIAAVFEIQNK